MAESLVFDILIGRNTASDGLLKTGRAAAAASDDVLGLAKRLDQVGAKSVKAKVGLEGNKQAELQLDKLNLKLLQVGRKVTPEISLDGALKASIEIKGIELELDKLNRQSASISGSGGGLGKLQSALSALFSAGGSAGQGAGGVGGGVGATAGSPGGIAAAIGLVTLIPLLEAATVEATGLASGLAAAGAGAGAFGLLALPTFKNIATAYTGIAAAQAKVTAAQQLDAASPTKANAAAVQKALVGVKVAQDNLSPSTRAAVKGIDDLMTEYKKMAKAFAPDALKVFNDALGIANTLLPDIKPFADTAATAIDGLLKKVGVFFKSADFKSWLSSFEQRTGPALTAIGDGIGKVAVSAGKLLTIMSSKDDVHAINIAFDTIDGLIIGLGYAIRTLMHNWDAMTTSIRHWSTNTMNALHLAGDTAKLVFQDIEIVALKAVDGVLGAFSNIPIIGHLFRTAHAAVSKELAGIEADSKHTWAAVQGDLQNLHGKTVNLAFGVKPPPGMSATSFRAAVGHAAGWRVPGYGGGDQWPALLEGGETVVPKHLTPAVAPLMKAHGVPGFAAGTLAGADRFSASFPSGASISSDTAALQAAVTAIGSALAQKLDKAFKWPSAAAPGGAAPSVSGSAVSWILAALRDTGAPKSWLGPLEILVGKESGGNPRAYNSTSVGGEHASGLFQTLPSTYAAFATVPGGVFNPVSDAVAGIRYIMSRYGSPFNIPGLLGGTYRGYAAGTGGAAPGWAVVGERGAELVRMRGGEDVVPAGPTAALLGLRGYASGTLTPRQAAALAARQLKSEQAAGLSLANYYASPGTTAGIQAEEARYLRDIAKYFEGSSAKWRDKAVERQTGRVADVGNQIRTLGSRLASARSYQQSVQQGLSGYADLSTTTLGGSMLGTRQISAGASLQGQLGQKLANLRKFGQVIGKLSAAHVDRSLIRQVVALGPDQGAAYGQEILSGGPKLIRALNREESAISSTELRISRGAASAVYEGRYQPGRHFLHQLQDDKAGLDKLFRDLGKTLGEEAVRWFRVPKGRRPKGFASGGVLTEPVLGYGASGQSYTFAENGPERIVPGGGRPAGPLVHIENFNPREYADVAILAQQLSFTVTRAGLG